MTSKTKKRFYDMNVHNQGPQKDRKRKRESSIEHVAPILPQPKLEFRLSLVAVVNLNKGLTPEQRNAVRDIGFGGLLDIQCSQLKHPLVKWLLENIDPMTMKLDVHGKQLEIKIEDVQYIMGLPNRKNPVPIDEVDDMSIERLAHRYHAGDRRAIPLLTVHKELMDCNTHDDNFKRLYVICMVGFLLTPTTEHNAVRRDILRALKDVNNIASYNWAKFVFDDLSQSLVKSQGRRYIRGCIFILIIFFLEHVYPLRCSKVMHGLSPCVKYWTDARISKRLGQFYKGAPDGFECPTTCMVDVKKLYFEPVDVKEAGTDKRQRVFKSFSLVDLEKASPERRSAKGSVRSPTTSFNSRIEAQIHNLILDIKAMKGEFHHIKGELHDIKAMLRSIINVQRLSVKKGMIVGDHVSRNEFAGNGVFVDENVAEHKSVGDGKFDDDDDVAGNTIVADGEFDDENVDENRNVVGDEKEGEKVNETMRDSDGGKFDENIVIEQEHENNITEQIDNVLKDLHKEDNIVQVSEEDDIDEAFQKSPMERTTPQSRPTKRPLEEEFNNEFEGSRKKALVPVKSEDSVDFGTEKNYNFRVLLPNGKTVEVKIHGTRSEMHLDEFVNVVRKEYIRILRQTESQKPQRSVNWKSDDLHIVDANGNKIRYILYFRRFTPNKWNILRLQDGLKEANEFENMWDLTPDTNLLKELPAEYTFETALADLIDNSLQAVWSNKPNERRLISLEMKKNKIIIFDTGPGMDGSDENSIAKWGKMGASLHRSARMKAIGGKPPYLVPFFGMFGYGGPIASMHLGRCAFVSSKMKKSEKVYMLHLERDALLSCSSSEQSWRTKGGLRDPSENELEQSSGSFTKVEIVEPKIRTPDISQLQCKLKDIYFPYIQCDADSDSGRTIRPIEFQVNGIDLAEIEGGEVATTNLLSCNGPEFTFLLRFTTNVTSSSQESKALEEANARVKCAYFPIMQGKETIDTILEKLEADGYGITENYERFSRVSIRRLGRLLPDARWPWLPFMDLRQKKGDKAPLLKRCCYRVKCFIETDAGFNPTPSKTDLAQHHPYTTVLRNLGDKILENDRDVHVEIYIDGKQVSIQLLDKKYQEWILKMHDRYDEEIDSGADEPTYVFNPLNKKELRLSSDVLRIHKAFQRKGIIWKSGQKIKVLKGACAGFHKNNVYATLEYMILEGVQGDAGGEARIICRPIDVPDEKACLLSINNGNPTIEIRNSMSFPISVIDAGKCIAVGDDEWNSKLELRLQKVPSSIDLLRSDHCQEIEVGEALPIDIIDAGHGPPKEIIAVIRPATFDSANVSLDQKYIVKENCEMKLEIKFEDNDGNAAHIYSSEVAPSSRNKFQGLYIFSLKDIPQLFEKAGVYTFLLSLKEVICSPCEKKVRVKASTEVGSWRILSKEQAVNFCARTGLCFPPFSLACYDRFSNRIPFPCNPEVLIKFRAVKGVYIHVSNMNVSFSEDKLTMTIEDVRVESSNLDKIRPKYESTLLLCPQDESLSLAVPCQVFPGPLDSVAFQTPYPEKQLLPGHTIKDLVLEMFDAYGNHVKKNDNVQLHVEGFCLQDKKGSVRKVDDRGFLDLSGILKVTKRFGESASLSVLQGEKLVSKTEFVIEERELRAAFEVPVFCIAGSQLENLVFQVIDAEGEVDEKFNEKDEYGIFHTLTLKSDTLNIDDSVQYTFRHGRCTVRSISVPDEEGVFSLIAAHSSHPELHLNIELRVEQAVNLGHESENVDENILLLQNSPAVITPKREVEHGSSDGGTLLLPSSCSTQDVLNLIGANMDDQKELEEAMIKYAMSVGQLEDNIKRLEYKQLKLEDGVTRLRATIDHDGCDVMDKKVIMEKIDNKHHSAAAVVCKLLGSSQSERRHRDFAENILGVVALLGTVQSNDLSRMLAQYLGEDQMLAIVCKSYSGASAFEKNEPNERNNHASAFDELASSLGYSVNGQYLVICLEDVRPYRERIGRDPQRTLSLPDPIVNGRTPPGYVGYAVNMIHLDENHLQWRTAAGYGLRETLYYCLFGKLQVYKTREHMNMARSFYCIKHGAVSLDGGIIRGNGVVSLGSREPEIQFPVASNENQVRSSPNNARILKMIEEMNMELKETTIRLEEDTKMHKKIKKKFAKTKDKYHKFFNEKASAICNLRGLYSPQPASDQN